MSPTKSFNDGMGHSQSSLIPNNPEQPGLKVSEQPSSLQGICNGQPALNASLKKEEVSNTYDTSQAASVHENGHDASTVTSSDLPEDSVTGSNHSQHASQVEIKGAFCNKNGNDDDSNIDNDNNDEKNNDNATIMVPVLPIDDNATTMAPRVSGDRDTFETVSSKNFVSTKKCDMVFAFEKPPGKLRCKDSNRATVPLDIIDLTGDGADAEAFVPHSWSSKGAERAPGKTSINSAIQESLCLKRKNPHRDRRSIKHPEQVDYFTLDTDSSKKIFGGCNPVLASAEGKDQEFVPSSTKRFRKQRAKEAPSEANQRRVAFRATETMMKNMAKAREEAQMKRDDLQIVRILHLHEGLHGLFTVRDMFTREEATVNFDAKGTSDTESMRLLGSA
ncbi:hypothetical protein MMC25_007365 [Agyrium rufum]|nr:hypothetical protein [Agyrium rufum]